MSKSSLKVQLHMQVVQSLDNDETQVLKQPGGPPLPWGKPFFESETVIDISPSECLPCDAEKEFILPETDHLQERRRIKIGEEGDFQCITKDAWEQIQRHPEAFSSGVVAHHLPRGFYLQRIRHHRVALCFDEKKALIPAPHETPLTILCLHLDEKWRDCAWLNGHGPAQIKREMARLRAMDASLYAILEKKARFGEETPEQWCDDIRQLCLLGPFAREWFATLIAYHPGLVSFHEMSAAFFYFWEQVQLACQSEGSSLNDLPAFSPVQTQQNMKVYLQRALALVQHSGEKKRQLLGLNGLDLSSGTGAYCASRHEGYRIVNKKMNCGSEQPCPEALFYQLAAKTHSNVPFYRYEKMARFLNKKGIFETKERYLKYANLIFQSESDKEFLDVEAFLYDDRNRMLFEDYHNWSDTFYWSGLFKSRKRRHLNCSEWHLLFLVKKERMANSWSMNFNNMRPTDRVFFFEQLEKESKKKQPNAYKMADIFSLIQVLGPLSEEEKIFIPLLFNVHDPFKHQRIKFSNEHNRVICSLQAIEIFNCTLLLREEQAKISKFPAESTEQNSKMLLFLNLLLEKAKENNLELNFKTEEIKRIFLKIKTCEEKEEISRLVEHVWRGFDFPFDLNSIFNSFRMEIFEFLQSLAESQYDNLVLNIKEKIGKTSLCWEIEEFLKKEKQKDWDEFKKNMPHFFDRAIHFLKCFIEQKALKRMMDIDTCRRQIILKKTAINKYEKRKKDIEEHEKKIDDFNKTKFNNNSDEMSWLDAIISDYYADIEEFEAIIKEEEKHKKQREKDNLHEEKMMLPDLLFFFKEECQDFAASLGSFFHEMQKNIKRIKNKDEKDSVGSIADRDALQSCWDKVFDWIRQDDKIKQIQYKIKNEKNRLKKEKKQKQKEKISVLEEIDYWIGWFLWYRDDVKEISQQTKKLFFKMLDILEAIPQTTFGQQAESNDEEFFYHLAQLEESFLVFLKMDFLSFSFRKIIALSRKSIVISDRLLKRWVRWVSDLPINSVFNALLCCSDWSKDLIMAIVRGDNAQIKACLAELCQIFFEAEQARWANEVAKNLVGFDHQKCAFVFDFLMDCFDDKSENPIKEIFDVIHEKDTTRHEKEFFFKEQLTAWRKEFKTKKIDGIKSWREQLPDQIQSMRSVRAVADFFLGLKRKLDEEDLKNFFQLICSKKDVVMQIMGCGGEKKPDRLEQILNLLQKKYASSCIEKLDQILNLLKKHGGPFSEEMLDCAIHSMEMAQQSDLMIKNNDSLSFSAEMFCFHYSLKERKKIPREMMGVLHFFLSKSNKSMQGIPSDEKTRFLNGIVSYLEPFPDLLEYFKNSNKSHLLLAIFIFNRSSKNSSFFQVGEYRKALVLMKDAPDCIVEKMYHFLKNSDADLKVSGACDELQRLIELHENPTKWDAELKKEDDKISSNERSYRSPKELEDHYSLVGLNDWVAQYAQLNDECICVEAQFDMLQQMTFINAVGKGIPDPDEKEGVVYKSAIPDTTKPLSQCMEQEILHLMHGWIKIVRSVDPQVSEAKKCSAQLKVLAALREIYWIKTAKMPNHMQILSVWLAFRTFQKTGRPVSLEADPGEGKSIITALLAVMMRIQNEDFFVHVDTLHAALVMQDYKQRKNDQFFQGCALRSAVSYEKTITEEDRQSHDILYSFSALRSLKYMGLTVLEERQLYPAGKKPVLIVDEGDRLFFHDNREYNLSNESELETEKELLSDLYEHMYAIFISLNQAQPDWYKSEFLGRKSYWIERFKDLLKDNGFDEEFVDEIPDEQFSEWIWGAYTASELVSGEHFLEQETDVLDGNGLPISSYWVAVPLVEDNPQVGSSMLKVHQFLHVRLKKERLKKNLPVRKEDFPIELETKPVGSETPWDYIDFYHRQDSPIFMISATAIGSWQEKMELQLKYGFSFLKFPPYKKSKRIKEEAVFVKNLQEKFQFLLKKMDALQDEAQKMGETGAPSLVICKDNNELQSLWTLFQDLPAYDGKVDCINGSESQEDLENKIKKAAQNGCIMLVTRFAGRGIDVILENKNHPIGLCVFRLAVTRLADEIQFMGRGARNGQNGRDIPCYALDDMEKQLDHLSLSANLTAKADEDEAFIHHARMAAVKLIQEKMEEEPPQIRDLNRTSGKIKTIFLKELDAWREVLLDACADGDETSKNKIRKRLLNLRKQLIAQMTGIWDEVLIQFEESLASEKLDEFEKRLLVCWYNDRDGMLLKLHQERDKLTLLDHRKQTFEELEQRNMEHMLSALALGVPVPDEQGRLASRDFGKSDLAYAENVEGAVLAYADPENEEAKRKIGIGLMQHAVKEWRSFFSGFSGNMFLHEEEFDRDLLNCLARMNQLFDDVTLSLSQQEHVHRVAGSFLEGAKLVFPKDEQTLIENLVVKNKKFILEREIAILKKDLRWVKPNGVWQKILFFFEKKSICQAAKAVFDFISDENLDLNDDKKIKKYYKLLLKHHEDIKGTFTFSFGHKKVEKLILHQLSFLRERSKSHDNINSGDFQDITEEILFENGKQYLTQKGLDKLPTLLQNKIQSILETNPTVLAFQEILQMLMQEMELKKERKELDGLKPIDLMVRHLQRFIAQINQVEPALLKEERFFEITKENMKKRQNGGVKGSCDLVMKEGRVFYRVMIESPDEKMAEEQKIVERTETIVRLRHLPPDRLNAIGLKEKIESTQKKLNETQIFLKNVNHLCLSVLKMKVRWLDISLGAIDLNSEEAKAMVEDFQNWFNKHELNFIDPKLLDQAKNMLSDMTQSHISDIFSEVSRSFLLRLDFFSEQIKSLERELQSQQAAYASFHVDLNVPLTSQTKEVLECTTSSPQQVFHLYRALVLKDVPKQDPLPNPGIGIAPAG